MVLLHLYPSPYSIRRTYTRYSTAPQQEFLDRPVSYVRRVPVVVASSCEHGNAAVRANKLNSNAKCAMNAAASFSVLRILTSFVASLLDASKSSFLLRRIQEF